MTVTPADIEAAAATLDGHVIDSPCVRSRTLSEICGAEIWLKLENLQYTGSFKERGALIRLLALAPDERRRGVIAMSAGNHAQGVAYHAARLGIPATIVMPAATPMVKIRNTELLGARVLVRGDSLDEAYALARDTARDDGLTLVHPYDDPRIIAGQGTVAREILRDGRAFDALVVPIGGGGLISGVAIAAKALRFGIEVVGVQAALYPSMLRALEGQPAEPGGPTIAEGIAVKRPGTLTIEIIRRLVDEILLVDEAHLEHAVQLTVEIEKTVAEGAGAAPLAAVLAHPARFAGKRLCLVVSGGNIDARLLASVLMRGLVRAGRLMRLRVEVSDQPGSLSRISACIGALGGNILEVHHQRWFYDVPIKLAEVDIVVETRDADHLTRIVAGLGEAGFRARALSSRAEGDAS
ncbi:MAG: threonine ammonia-lyase [Alphaproteobacteria bacterium]